MAIGNLKSVRPDREPDEGQAPDEAVAVAPPAAGTSTDAADGATVEAPAAPTGDARWADDLPPEAETPPPAANEPAPTPANDTGTSAFERALGATPVDAKAPAAVSRMAPPRRAATGPAAATVVAPTAPAMSASGPASGSDGSTGAAWDSGPDADAPHAASDAPAGDGPAGDGGSGSARIREAARNLQDARTAIEAAETDEPEIREAVDELVPGHADLEDEQRRHEDRLEEEERLRRQRESGTGAGTVGVLGALVQGGRAMGRGVRGVRTRFQEGSFSKRTADHVQHVRERLAMKQAQVVERRKDMIDDGIGAIGEAVNDLNTKILAAPAADPLRKVVNLEMERTGRTQPEALAAIMSGNASDDAVKALDALPDVSSVPEVAEARKAVEDRLAAVADMVRAQTAGLDVLRHNDPSYDLDGAKDALDGQAMRLRDDTPKPLQDGDPSLQERIADQAKAMMEAMQELIRRLTARFARAA